jgi:hypothetical protein
MEPFVYTVPAARVVFGSGTKATLADEIRRLSCGRAVVEAGQRSLFSGINPIVTDSPDGDGGEKAANHQIDCNEPRRSA